MAVAVPALAQQPQRKPPARTESGEELTPHLVKTGLYLISGGGGNSLLRFSAAGSVLVNGKLPGSYHALMSHVRRLSRLSDLPVRVLVVTDHHLHHAGNNALFLAAGIPILVQENAKSRLPAHASSGRSAETPVVTYDRNYTLRLGGVELQPMHFGNARTDGDTVVYFPDLKVVAVGDVYTPDAPDPDFSGGGSLVGWSPVLAQILKLDFDVAVPSTGPTITRADLEAFKTKVDILVSRATGLVRRAVPQDQLMAELQTDDLGWRLSFTESQVQRFYAELSQAN